MLSVIRDGYPRPRNLIHPNSVNPLKYILIRNIRFPNLPDGTKVTFKLIRIGVGECGQPISTNNSEEYDKCRRIHLQKYKKNRNESPVDKKMEGVDLTAEISARGPNVLVKKQGHGAIGECQLEITVYKDITISKWQKTIPVLGPGQTTIVSFSDLIASLVNDI